MITSHSEARDYACTVLDFCGAPRIVRERIEQIITSKGGDELDDRDVRACASSPYGVLVIKSNEDLTLQDELEGARGNMCAPIGYTLPIEPHELKRRIITAYKPSALHHLKARGVRD